MALAVKEGMIRNIANRVTSDGIGAFDVELQAVWPWGRSSTRCTRGSPTSPSLEPPERPSMTNHRGIRTRPSTLSIGQGRSAN